MVEGVGFVGRADALSNFLDDVLNALGWRTQTVSQVAGFCRWLQAKKCSAGVRNLERTAFAEKLICKAACF